MIYSNLLSELQISWERNEVIARQVLNRRLLLQQGLVMSTQCVRNLTSGLYG